MSAAHHITALAPLIAAQTLLQLAAGTALFAWLLDWLGHIGRGYRGSTAVICACVAAVAWLLLGGAAQGISGINVAGATSAHNWCALLVGALVVDLFFVIVGTDVASRAVGALPLVVGALALYVTAGVFSVNAWIAALTAFTGAALCGATMAGMLLGHWYLLAPNLSFKPLRQATYLIFLTVLAFAAGQVVLLITASAAARHDITAGSQAFVFWLLVVGAGVVMTAVVNGLTLHFARVRANQPATAMLYALIITSLMGAVPAALVYVNTGA